MKLQTPVEVGRSSVRISYKDRIMLLGSCFSDNIGGKMKDMGFDVMVNPFGPLYNPVSVFNAIARMRSASPFTESECIQMGAGSELICSFSHHTAAARKTAEQFLSDANTSLKEASDFYKSADTLIITLGTSWVYRHKDSGEIVANCLKRDGREFVRERLDAGKITAILESGVMGMERPHGDCNPKRVIFTVSPIRHLSDGAHGNQISKSTLLLSEENICEAHPQQCVYFPAYEIVMDELRDYRFYAEDMIHPSQQTVDYLWERFCDFALPEDEKPVLERNRKQFLQSRHRQITV